MADISSTGQSSTQNYFIGRGSVYLAELIDGTPQAWRAVGNVADLNVEADTSVIEHFSSQTFARTKDAEVISQLSLNFNITFDEWMYENLSEFFLGSTETFQQAGAGQTPAAASSASIGAGSQFIFSTPASGISDTSIGGRYYDLYYVGGNLVIGSADQGYTHEQRVYNIDPAELTISGNAHRAGWVYDQNTGQIFIEDGGLVDIAALADIALDPNATVGILGVTYGAALPSFTMSEMSAITSDQKTLAVKFIAINGNVQGEKHEIILHQAKIRPQGSLGLINEDDFGQITLEGSLERNTVVDPDGGGYVTIRKIS